MEPTHEMKNEAIAMRQDVDRFDSIILQIGQIPISEYVLVKADEGLYPAYVGRFSGVVKAGDMWRIKLYEMGVVLRTEKKYEIGNWDEFISERNELFLISAEFDETTKHIQGRRTASKKLIEERRKEYLNSYYPSVHFPRIVGMDAVSKALEEYGLTWKDYMKAVS